MTVALAAAWLTTGCGSPEKRNPRYFTSGNREADQRAEQRVAKAQQLRSAGREDGGDGEESAPMARSLYDRLGGAPGIRAIVEDYVPRVLADPRVNWRRKGVTSGGFLGLGGDSVTWEATPEDVEQLKLHLAQFIAVASGGPTKYDGKQIKGAHRGMKITNAQFDASVGDMKATLDKLGVATAEQKELLAIIESTRPEIVEER